MKSLNFALSLILVLLNVLSCNGQKINKESSQMEFATIHKDSYQYLQDTVAFKKKLEGLSSKHTLHYDKIEIIKQMTIGFGSSKSTAFYYVLVSDSKLHFKVSRWLYRVGDKLYLNNRNQLGDQFEQTYQICFGVHNCSSEVFDIDGKKCWGCSKDPACLKETPDPATITCRAAKTLLLDELID